MSISQKFKVFFLSAIYIQVFAILVSFFFLSSDLTLVGLFMGKFSIYVFWLIALAGILQRFKVQGFLKKVQLILLSNRRQLGIWMFVLALSHFLWNRAFSYIRFGFPNSIPLFQVFGMLALLLALPLILTSNNYSVKKLGKFWKTLHLLVYPIMFLLVLHTAMQGKDFQLFGLNFGWDYTLSYALPSLVILFAQLGSWWYIYNKKSKSIAKI